MGTQLVDFYKYGERTAPTTSDAQPSYGLFYDPLPLFIAIIVMATICLLILIFGLAYLRMFRHQRSWDTGKDAVRYTSSFEILQR